MTTKIQNFIANSNGSEKYRLYKQTYEAMGQPANSPIRQWYADMGFVTLGEIETLGAALYKMLSPDAIESEEKEFAKMWQVA